jgi:hypothetical protein
MNGMPMGISRLLILPLMIFLPSLHLLPIPVVILICPGRRGQSSGLPIGVVTQRTARAAMPGLPLRDNPTRVEGVRTTATDAAATRSLGGSHCDGGQNEPEHGGQGDAPNDSADGFQHAHLRSQPGPRSELAPLRAVFFAPHSRGVSPSERSTSRCLRRARKALMAS